jgi:hypothetical protein
MKKILTRDQIKLFDDASQHIRDLEIKAKFYECALFERTEIEFADMRYVLEWGKSNKGNILLYIDGIPLNGYSGKIRVEVVKEMKKLGLIDDFDDEI